MKTIKKIIKYGVVILQFLNNTTLKNIVINLINLIKTIIEEIKKLITELKKIEDK